MAIAFHHKHHIVAVAMLSVLLPAAGGVLAAPPAIGSVAALYPPGSIKTNGQAAQALLDVAAERALVETRFSADERACYPKFFTTSCLDQVTDSRRHALAVVRPVEIEAERTQRLLTALERDAAIAAREQQEALEAPQRAQREQEHRDSQAARQATARPDVDPQAIARDEADFAKRQADHAAKLQAYARQDALKAQAAPANIAAFEKKQRDAEVRQQDVANKKAERLARQAREDAQKASEDAQNAKNAAAPK